MQMGVVHAIKCRTCNVMRNVDKLGTLIVPAENRRNALAQCYRLEQFRAYLLASFLKEHEGHDCTLLNDTDPSMEAEYYSSGEETVDFWYNKSSALSQLEQAARTRKIGLWAKDAPIAPWDYRDGKRPVQVAQRAAEVKPAAPVVKAPETATAPEPAKPKTEVTVYLTETGTHYHSAGCRHLKKSSIAIPLSRASAYTPCQHCSPPRP